MITMATVNVIMAAINLLVAIRNYRDEKRINEDLQRRG